LANRREALIHVGLFVWSSLTMLTAGLIFAGAELWAVLLGAGADLSIWGAALGYAVCMMAILALHELGHIIQARRHEVPVSWPYFLPGIGPLPPGMGGAVIPLMGTFGAFIRMQWRAISARALLEIGAGGPILGFIVTVPVMALGLYLSDVRPLPADAAEGMRLGDSLLMWGLQRVIVGPIPEGYDVYLHPVGMAGWAGGLLTALNLTPLGQLDGGHIAYSVMGERFDRVASWLFVGLLVLGVVAFTGWLFLAALVGWMGHRHPPLMEGEPVRGWDAWQAGACAVILALTFTPQPIVAPTLLEMLRGAL
jgi:membrane-associated protease RseP (regulator of RpoE activity)